MKKITSLLTLICALFITNATAQVNQTVVFDFTNNAWGIPTLEETNYSGVKSDTELTDQVNEIRIDPTANKGKFYYDENCLRLEKTGSKIILPTFDFDVEKIEVTGNSNASQYMQADLNVYLDSKAICEAATGLTETHTFNIAPEHQKAGNIYELVIGEKGGNYSSIIFINSIKVYPKASENALTITAPLFDKEAGVYTEPVTVALTSPTTEFEGVTDVVYYYTTDGNTPDAECDEVVDGMITISESCTLKVVLEFKYNGETYTSEATEAEYIISKAVTYEKATERIIAGKYFIVANNLLALPFNEGSLPTKEATIEGDKVTDAEYYAYTIEEIDGLFYIKDAKGKYINFSSMAKVPKIFTSDKHYNANWNITLEDGVAKITKDGYALAFEGNKFIAVIPNETTVYPSLYEVPRQIEDTTSIDEVKTEDSVICIYDLTGRQIDEITKPGIYIVNGKKVLVK